jgi:uncharacterized protein YlxW (UPF0749 family)
MTDRADEVQNASVALLIDLVTNTLDPGYAAAASRAQTADPPRRGPDRILLAIGCLLVGFTLVVAYVNTHRAAPQEAVVHTDLVNRVRAAQSSADHLQSSAQKLSARIDTLRNQALGGSAPLRAQLQTEQVLAGTIAVSGPGLLVVLSDPAVPTASSVNGRPGTTPLTQTEPLTDRDIRSVVNELWRDGAEAISVNGIRLTATSAIRFAGEAVLVDFEPINPPYSFRAIGNADQLDTGFAESDVASRYNTLAAAEGIGFSFTEHSNLHLSASTLTGPDYARSVGSSDTASSAPTASPVVTGSASSVVPPTAPATSTSTATEPPTGAS